MYGTRLDRRAGIRKPLTDRAMKLTKQNDMDIVMEERPDIRANEKGYESLTTIELLSLILGGSNQFTMNLAMEVFKKADCDLTRLHNLTEKDLCSIPNIGKTKAKSIFASLELGRRISMAIPERDDLSSSVALFNLMRPKVQGLQYEEFWIILLNQNCKMLKVEKISTGGLTEVAADIRVMMKEALLNNATVIACCHNHPSGSIHPSRQDDQLTERIRKACETMRLYFLDHIIIGDGEYYSYRDKCRL